ncbi:MAG TPA: TCR/Tet family MFS transporter [Candidatus Polarisedimenticolaceae bacterium]|nr:TCR/Tet family MFS transporter [Candidatus Polarisedimenticolaceae bacterium]
MTSPPRSQRHALAFIAITLLLDTIGFGLIVPVMPRLLETLTGKPASVAVLDAGWLTFVYASMQFLCAPILGGLSDRFGRRPVLLAAIGALGVDYVVMGFAPTLPWLFLGRSIAGMAGASFTPAYAYVADISAPEKRAQNFGIVSAMFGVGFITGPALGGLLGGLGPRAPFFAAAALSSINFLYGLFVLPESLPAERRRRFDWKRANALGTMRQLRKHPAVWGLLVALFLWMLANQVMPSTWSFYTKYRFGWAEGTIGASLALAGLVMASAQALVPRLVVPVLGERGAALTGIVVGGLGYAAYGLATSGWMMFAILPTWFFGAIVMPTTNALMSHRVPPDAQGELQGAVASLFSVSSILGPPLMTQLFGRFTAPGSSVHVPGAAFFAAWALTIGCFFIYRAATRGQ